jgi:hypothetical protein
VAGHTHRAQEATRAVALPRGVSIGSLTILLVGLILPSPAFAQYNQTLPWNYSVGNAGSFSAYLNGQLQLSGAVTGTSVVAQSAAGGSILGHQKDIITASASASAYLTGDSSANVSLKVLGITAYSYSPPPSTPLTISDTYKKTFDAHETGHFPVGPFEVSVTIGVSGTASISYSLGLKAGGASASVTPSVKAQTYGMAGIGDGFFVEVGVGANLTLVDDSLPITATAQLSPNNFAVPPAWGVKWDFDITNKLNLLSGNIFLYATIDWWFGSDTWKTTIFSWPGFQINNTLFHDGGWTSIGIPLPQLSTLDPGSVSAGSSDLPLTLNGSGFSSDATVTWNGSTVAATYISASQLKALIPAALFFTPGTANVSVTNPGLLGGTSNKLPVHIVVPPPFVTRISPGGVTAGGPALSLTVDGGSLIAGSTILWNSTPIQTTHVSDTRLTASVPASLISSVGTVQINVVQPQPYNQTSNIISLPVFSPIPTVSSSSPSRVWPGSSDLTVHVIGTGFLPASSVYWNGAPLQTTYVSALQLDASVPASLMVQKEIVAIDVINPSSAPSDPIQFTISPVTYNAVEIPSLTYNSIYPLDIRGVNDNGVITGNAPTGPNTNAAFVWDQVNGLVMLPNFPTCPNPCPAPMYASAINNSNQIVGFGSVDSVGHFGAFMYANGVLTSLSGLEFAYAINDIGQVVGLTGSASTPPGSLGDLRLWQAGHTVLIDSPTIVGNSVISLGASAINNLGQIVGSTNTYTPTGGGINLLQAASWTGGQRSRLPSLGYSFPCNPTAGQGVLCGDSQAYAINDLGTIAGTAINQSILWQAVFWENGQVHAIGSTSGRIQTQWASGVSGNGDVVGNGNENFVSSPGWLFSHGQLFDLNTLLSNTVNGKILSAVSISSKGNIAAILLRPDGTQGGLLLKPDPISGLSIPAALLKTRAIPAATSNPPTLTGLQPSTIIRGSGTSLVTLIGTAFVPGTTAYWNGIPLSTAFSSNTSITATVSSTLLLSAGYATVVAVNPGGDTSNALAITIANATPTLASSSPAQLIAGASGFIVTVTGTGFLQGSIVYWNGAPLATTYQSATQLTAVVGAGLVASPATAAVTVVSPGPGGGASNALVFRINPPAPVLTNISPSSVVAGAPGFALTLSGTGFDQTSVVLWNNIPLPTTFLSATTLSAQVPASYLATPATPTVQVSDTIPNTWPSRGIQFLITYPSPQVTTLSPNSVQAGSADLTLTVNGAGFVDGSQVYLNGDPLPTTYISGSQLNAAAAAGDVALAATSQITVVNPQPSTSPQSGPLTFTVTDPPMIQDVTPAMGRQGSTPIVVTLRGKGFTGQSVVTWNDSPIATTPVSGTQLTATVPAANLAVPGTFPIRVVQQTTGGGRSRAVSFTVNNTPPPVPTITGLAPSSIVAGADHFGLSVSGTGFLSMTTGLWNGVPLPTTFISPTQVIVHVPAASIVSPGAASIRLQNPADDTGAGGGVSNPMAFSVLSGSASGVQIIVTRLLSRDGSNNIVVQLTLANTGSTPASDVILTGVKIGTASGTPLPQTIGTILPNSSTQVAVTVPPSAGSSGAASSLTVTGTYTGGTFTSTARLTLP